MKTRNDFHQELVKALGTPYVYYQPPEGLIMHKGNRIIYSREEIDFSQADNKKYIGHSKYSVTLVSKNPDWTLVEDILHMFQYCRHDRHYVADNLNHDVYIIYY